MPLYEYVCSDCKTKFEIRRAMSLIDAPTNCPHCQGDHVARQISRVAAFGRDDSGSVSSVGGGGCGSCGGGSCGSCASRN
ncbi:MAG: zinc ribbon domain-containing protein [Chloroflexi bacterium]|nr:zinc ribbon domain-containing protein [Chloroflexota bacterium]